MAELTPSSTVEDILAALEALGSERNRAGMGRFGIAVERAYGVGHTELRPMARRLKRDHARALALWDTGRHEARLLAGLTGEPARLTVEQCRRWAEDFDSWDIVDGIASLFVETPFWKELIVEFATDEREFVRRTAFAMLAWAAVHRKKEPDAALEAFLPLVELHSTDPRNFVKKAVNWALRQIGKRSMALHGPALALAQRLAISPDRTARWIGKDAVRELSDPRTLERLARR